MIRMLMLVVMLLPGAVAAAESPGLMYQVETAVWCSGDLRGESELKLEAGQSESVEIEANDTTWRLSVEVENTTPAEVPDPDSVWLKVGIEQQIDGEWEFVTDTMMGQPLGETARLTVIGSDDAEASPELAPLYVELVAKRLK